MSGDELGPEATIGMYPTAGGRVQLDTFTTGRVLELTLIDEAEEQPPVTVALNPLELRTLGRYFLQRANIIDRSRT